VVVTILKLITGMIRLDIKIESVQGCLVAKQTTLIKFRWCSHFIFLILKLFIFVVMFMIIWSIEP